MAKVETLEQEPGHGRPIQTARVSTLSSRRAVAGTWLLVCMLTSGCQDHRAAPAMTAHPVRYELEWSWDNVKRAADGASWEVTNDLGFRVRVTRGYVTSYSMELVECPRDATPVAKLDTLVWPMIGGTAYAGHATGTPNPAAIRAMQVESLSMPAASEAGSVMLSPQAYCQLHYLVARASREAHGLPTEVDMVDTSLHIEGTYQAPGTTTEVPFTVHTAAAYGALFDHSTSSSAAIHVDTGTAATQVICTALPRQNLRRRRLRPDARAGGGQPGIEVLDRSRRS